MQHHFYDIQMHENVWSTNMSVFAGNAKDGIGFLVQLLKAYKRSKNFKGGGAWDNNLEAHD